MNVRRLLAAPVLVLAVLTAASCDSGGHTPQPASGPTTTAVPGADAYTLRKLGELMSTLDAAAQAVACETYNADPVASFKRLTSAGHKLDEATVSAYMKKVCT